MQKNYELTLALAGVCQAAKLVHQFAHHGEADLSAFEVSLRSLLQTAPPTTLDIYGGNAVNLRLGLSTLLEQFSSAKGEFDLEISRYWMSLIALEGKFNKSEQAKEQLRLSLQDVERGLMHYQLLDDQILSKLAAIYVDVISPLGAKIQVQGAPLYLQQIAIHHRVRATLLAGIRSAVLWRQLGGTKLQLLFSRGKFYATAKEIYSTL